MLYAIDSRAISGVGADIHMRCQDLKVLHQILEETGGRMVNYVQLPILGLGRWLLIIEAKEEVAKALDAVPWV